MGETFGLWKKVEITRDGSLGSRRGSRYGFVARVEILVADGEAAVERSDVDGIRRSIRRCGQRKVIH